MIWCLLLHTCGCERIKCSRINTKCELEYILVALNSYPCDKRFTTINDAETSFKDNVFT